MQKLVMILMGIKIRINCGESDSDDNDKEMLMLMLMMWVMVMVMMMKYGWNARYAPHCSSPTYSAQLRIVRLQLHLRLDTLLLKNLFYFFFFRTLDLLRATLHCLTPIAL